MVDIFQSLHEDTSDGGENWFSCDPFSTRTTREECTSMCVWHDNDVSSGVCVLLSVPAF